MTQVESTRIYRKTIKGFTTYLYYNMKVRNIRRFGVALPFTSGQFRVWLITRPEFNPLWTNWVQSGRRRDLTPSVDRIDCMQPYTFDNMQLMRFQDNNRKTTIENPLYKNKAVLVFDWSGELLGRFPSTKDCGNTLRLRKESIARCARRERRTYRGLTFVYEADYKRRGR